MTYKEAKMSILTYCVEVCGMIDSCELSANKNCVEALVISALEKQIPKKLIEDRYCDIAVCPNCGCSVINEADNDYNFEHCYHCGQALDWED